jgi:uncharacterized protein
MRYLMRIRTITAGCNLSGPLLPSDKKMLAQITKDAEEIKAYFKQNGYTVQTVRLSTQPWESYASNKSELQIVCSFLQSLCKKKIDYFNIGPISTVDHIHDLSTILNQFPNGFCTVNLCQNDQINMDLVLETAKLIKEISLIEKQGFANLRFAALCNVSAHTPFYPASFHNGDPSFGIGCENSDIIHSVFSKNTSFEDAWITLHERLSNEYQKIEAIAKEACKDSILSYHGIDGSISPSIKKEESLIHGIEQLSFVDYFGGPGTVTAARLITSVLKQLPVRICGYNGLMLPVMEDSGLVKRNKEGKVSLTKLLLYSSVCGTGLDTIPLPGDITVEMLNGILLDVASLSIALKKPLSARLMPIPMKKAGDITEFDFDYFKNTTVMNP